MKVAYQPLAAFLAMAILFVGCSKQDTGSPPEKTAGPQPAAIEAPPDGWLGKWNGPEGTFLHLAGGHGKYEITIQNLNGPRRFQGTAVGPAIAFERDGTKESIRATNGDETGMKWLAGKSDCLTVRPGEGYCKD